MNSFRKQSIYWIANISGWAAYLLLSSVVLKGEGSLTYQRGMALLIAFPVGVLLAHSMRSLFGSCFFLLHSSIMGVIGSWKTFPWERDPFDVFQSVANWSLLFLFWSAIYFAYLFFEERRRKEIEALEWQASKSELELQQLKDQLDPHFIFNCLNSIRALIKEEPEKAEHAVTRLSNTLRGSLTLSRKNTISLRDEMKLIDDHLALEEIRLEERLRTEIKVPEAAMDQPVPPLLIQSLVENGIKHGISKLPEGGCLSLNVVMEEKLCRITVSNPGTFTEQSHNEKPGSTGIGMANAKKRLQLLFGNKAGFWTEERGGLVRTMIELPLDG